MPVRSVLSALPYSALESLWGPRRAECCCVRVPNGGDETVLTSCARVPALTARTSNRLTTQPRRRVPWKRRGLSQRAHCVRGGKEQHNVNLIRHR